MNTWRESLAWAAGFFDGEGYTGWHQPRGQRASRLMLSISQKDRRVLDRFKAAVGLGSINGPYSRDSLFYFQAQGFHVVQAIVAMMWTHLGEMKRAQATAALQESRTWPTYRHVCRNGHPRTPENTYVRGDRKICRPCNIQQNHEFRVRHLARALLTA